MHGVRSLLRMLPPGRQRPQVSGLAVLPACTWYPPCPTWVCHLGAGLSDPKAAKWWQYRVSTNESLIVVLILTSDMLLSRWLEYLKVDMFPGRIIVTGCDTRSWKLRVLSWLHFLGMKNRHWTIAGAARSLSQKTPQSLSHITFKLLFQHNRLQKCNQLWSKQSKGNGMGIEIIWVGSKDQL